MFSEDMSEPMDWANMCCAFVFSIYLFDGERTFCGILSDGRYTFSEWKVISDMFMNYGFLVIFWPSYAQSALILMLFSNTLILSSFSLLFNCFIDFASLIWVGDGSSLLLVSPFDFLFGSS
jgi:hypothetical protein